MPDLPAILGGTPLFPEGPPPWPSAFPAVKAALDEAFTNGSWGQYHGPNVSAFEAELAKTFGVSHALSCASGTLAVEVALRAAGVGPGDEVILAAYDYESTFLTVHHLGAKPVLVDVDPVTGQLDPIQLDAAWTSQTKTVVCSHLHGGLVDVTAVTAWAKARNVIVVEDAAQCPGAILAGKPAGSWGHYGTLSFGGSKLLTAGRGGAVLTSDDRSFQRAKNVLNRGVQQWAALSELQACVLRPQLVTLAEWTRQREEGVREILDTIRDVRGLNAFATPSPLTSLPLRERGSMSAYYKLGLHFDPAAFGLSRDLFCRAMRAEGVAFDPGFSALHVGRSPSRFRAVGTLPNATRLHDSCVILHHPVLTLGNEAASRVAEAIRRTYRNADTISRSRT